MFHAGRECAACHPLRYHTPNWKYLLKMCVTQIIVSRLTMHKSTLIQLAVKCANTSAHHFLKRTKHIISFLVPSNSQVRGEFSFCSNGTAITRTVVFLFFFQSSATVMREIDLFTQLLTSVSAGNWLMSAIKLQNYFSQHYSLLSLL